MNQTTNKRGSAFGTALSPVAKLSFSVALLVTSGLYVSEKIALDKAEERIVHYEKASKRQDRAIDQLGSELKSIKSELHESNRLIDIMKTDKKDLKSKYKKLLKDNEKLNRDLKSSRRNTEELEKMLKQTKLQASTKK